MAIVENEAVRHIQEHLGITHYNSMFSLVPFLENAFESEGYEEIKKCPRCQNFYAISLQYGSGIPKDDDKAIKLLTSAASQGYTKAMYNLASSYEEGRGVEIDFEKAFELCKAAADLNYPDAVAGLPRIAKKYRSSKAIGEVEDVLNED